MSSYFGDRFVDRDMFMRYRGGGIGHKYMRAIEAVYENMSRERNHHKEKGRGTTHSEKPTTMDVDDTEDAGADGEEGVKSTSQAGGQAQNAAEDNDNEGGNDGSDDDNYIPSSEESYSSGISDSDDLDSEGCEGYEEIHGFGEL